MSFRTAVRAKGTQGFALAVDFARPKHYIADLFKRLQECTLPVIARVNGHVMAGGFGLLCACDMAIAADDIRIGTTEAKIGVTPKIGRASCRERVRQYV